jgi:energy-coupling factor transport system ATP-binding protein
MITIKELSFQYSTGKAPVLNTINLTVNKGEYLAIVGPSGSGKSTLCLTLNGVIPHSITGTLSGDVMVNGKNTKEHKVHELAETVGIVLQNPESQLFAMSVEEELAFGPENLGLPRSEIAKRIDTALKTIGLVDRERFPFSLSGGEKQKLAIASILTMEPSYLVLDEPTSQLDPQGRNGVYAVLGDLFTKGMSLVLIEHNTEHVADHAQTVVVVHKGTLVKKGSPKTVFSAVENMKELGIQVPEVAEFTHELVKKGLINEVCVTLKEAENVLTHLKKESPTTTTVTNTFTYGPPVVEVNNVYFSYTNTPVLQGITFTVCQGEIVAVIGQNGSGKTTLVKHINGLLRPSSGEIFVEGESVKDKSVAEMARKVGYVFQNPDHQIFADTVFEEVEFGLKNLGVPEKERATTVSQVLKQTDLSQYEHTHPTSLSGGEKQRLAIASVLVMNPRILVLDEPTTGLDLKSSRAIIKLVKTLHSLNHTVILVTHDMKLVAEMARRIVIIQEGRIVADGLPHHIFSDKALLNQNFLEAPQITILSQMLGYGPCLTVSELLKAVTEVVE